jgi:guanosine-3',5'-bis(diphosphate) 3'-pyrophosphohydrolase
VARLDGGKALAKPNSHESKGLRLVIRAAAFAALKHRDQRRKDRRATPYINHPLALALVLSDEGDVRDPQILAAALLHDTIEDTQTSYQELRGLFGKLVADLVAEVTDTKFLKKHSRKKLQIAKAGHASIAAQQVKIADKLCNLRDVLSRPPKDWTIVDKNKYFDWAKSVIDQIRGANPRLARRFDVLYARERPRGPDTARTESEPRYHHMSLDFRQELVRDLKRNIKLEARGKIGPPT